MIETKNNEIIITLERSSLKNEQEVISELKQFCFMNHYYKNDYILQFKINVSIEDVNIACQYFNGLINYKWKNKF